MPFWCLAIRGCYSNSPHVEDLLNGAFTRMIYRVDVNENGKQKRKWSIWEEGGLDVEAYERTRTWTRWECETPPTVFDASSPLRAAVWSFGFTLPFREALLYWPCFCWITRVSKTIRFVLMPLMAVKYCRKEGIYCISPKSLIKIYKR